MIKRALLAIRWALIIWGFIEAKTSRIFPSQWVLKGGCKKTGACCKLIALEMPVISEKTSLYRWIKRWAILWNERVNGFTFAGSLENRWLGFTCNRLGKDNTCLDYQNRPRVCREYPLVRYFGKPRLAKGCGFHFSLRATKNKLSKNLLTSKIE